MERHVTQNTSISRGLFRFPATNIYCFDSRRFAGAQTPDLSYLKRRSNHSATLAEHVKVGDVIEEQVKVGAPLSVAPVNLNQKFAAANSPDKSRLDPEDNECVLIDGPHNFPVAPNRSLSKYSLSDAWTRNNLTTSHSKFSGASTSWHKLLQPELHCKQCSFPHSSTIIFIGDQSYLNKCTNTTV
jgi:hypothetical protein